MLAPTIERPIMKKLISYIAVLLVGLGLGFLVFHGATTKTPGQGMAGAQVQNDTFNFTGGFNAGTANQLAVSSTGALSSTAAISAATFGSATIGSSSSSPAALGSAAAGHFVLPTGGATVNASTTAVTVNSDVQIQQELTSPIAGTTCSSSIASGTAVTVLGGLGTNSGFKVTAQQAPVTNPFCFSYSINN